MKTRATINHNSGIPLGGIGTGSIEIRPDGYFHEWQIFNQGIWAPRQPRKTKNRDPKLGPDSLTFLARVKSQNGAPMVRRLGMRTDQNDLYGLSWAKNVQAIEYDGQFPMATLNYVDDSLPIYIKGQFLSPFVPLDERMSGTPGFYINFQLTNASDTPVDISIMGILANPLANDAHDRKLTNAINKTEKGTILSMTTAADHCSPALLGSLSLGSWGGETTYIAADYRQYFKGFNHRITEYHSFLSVLQYFQSTGKLQNLADRLENPSKLVRLIPGSLVAKKEMVARLQNYAFARDLYQRCQEVDAKNLETEAGLNYYLHIVQYVLFQVAKLLRTGESWGDGALCSSITLQPGETKDLGFVLSWHFPNHFSEKGDLMGHMYENWFKNAENVAKFLLNNRESIVKNVEKFTSVLFGTNLDPIVADAWAGQLSTIIKATWWNKSNQFAVWEGLGCCGFHTMDITYQGSWNLLALFPELQKSQMLLGANFQRADGRVHHFFTPDLSHVDRGFDRVDMNPQFVLLVARDFLWTKDRKYLETLWPHILKAMENSLELDADGDGLPDHDTRRNTYDAWNFFGTPSYIASLWLGALRAGIRLAQEYGDSDKVQKWQELLTKGIAAFDQKLWNGEYYRLWVDGNRKDECCMTDQMSGEWFSHLIGIGHSLDKTKIIAALKFVYKNNFSMEAGLINACYPPGKPPIFPTYKNVQAMAPWTGIEYAIGSMMIDFGLVEEGLNVLKAIDDRYLRAGRYWNHVECGDHYYRAMCSWAVLLATTGFKVDLPKSIIQFNPPFNNKEFKAPWFASCGWGSFNISPKSFDLICNGGELKCKTLQIKDVGQKFQKASLNGKIIPVTFLKQSECIQIQFSTEISIGSEQKLSITE